MKKVKKVKKMKKVKKVKKKKAKNQQNKIVKHTVSTAAPNPNSTTVLMTVPTDYEKQNKLYREKTNTQAPTSKAGKGGEGIRKGFLG